MEQELLDNFYTYLLRSKERYECVSSDNILDVLLEETDDFNKYVKPYYEYRKLKDVEKCYDSPNLDRILSPTPIRSNNVNYKVLINIRLRKYLNKKCPESWNS